MGDPGLYLGGGDLAVARGLLHLGLASRRAVRIALL